MTTERSEDGSTSSAEAYSAETSSREASSIEPGATEAPRIIVNDRRHWARDDEDDGDEAPRKPTYVAKLEAELEEKTRVVAEIRTQHKAARDEFENAKARLRREVDVEVKRGVKRILVSLLDVIDNLDRAVEASSDPDLDEESLRGGVRMVREQFLNSLEHVGVSREETVGRAFDPELHEAVSSVPVDDPELDGQVIGEVKGLYRFQDEVLRPAVVAVGKQQE
ncbi:MAG: nucleotide exchange factor GrpE [Myxococcota bacterium]